MSGTLKVFQAGTGDCMAVSFRGNDENKHHLVIDAGFEETFDDTLFPFLGEIMDKDNEECIDLFVITHIDKDHISGMQEFVWEFGDKRNLVSEYLFNFSPKSFNIFETKKERNIGVAEGVNLRDYLRGIGKLNNQPIVVP